MKERIVRVYPRDGRPPTEVHYVVDCWTEGALYCLKQANGTHYRFPIDRVEAVTELPPARPGARPA